MASEASQQQLRPSIDSVVLVVFGEKVLLDSDLAKIYSVGTGALNRAINGTRIDFPRTSSSN